MSNSSITKKSIQYSHILSTLLSSSAIIALSILCLLNNLSLDVYTLLALLKVVLPASCCFWLLGYVIGSILDKEDNMNGLKENSDKQDAYNIPSMFTDTESLVDNVDQNKELS